MLAECDWLESLPSFSALCFAESHSKASAMVPMTVLCCAVRCRPPCELRAHRCRELCPDVAIPCDSTDTINAVVEALREYNVKQP